MYKGILEKKTHGRIYERNLGLISGRNSSELRRKYQRNLPGYNKTFLRRFSGEIAGKNCKQIYDAFLNECFEKALEEHFEKCLRNPKISKLIIGVDQDKDIHFC